MFPEGNLPYVSGHARKTEIIYPTVKREEKASKQRGSEWKTADRMTFRTENRETEVKRISTKGNEQ